MAPSARRRRLRWFAPFATAAVIALIAAIPGLSAADTPSLAPLTPAQLLAKVHQAQVNNLSGTINLSTNLGIPNLSALTDAAGGGGRHGGQAFSVTDLLAGSHKALVWFAGPDKARVAFLQDMAETDVIHNGLDTWMWDSTTKKVTHYTGTPAKGSGTAGAKDANDATTNPAEPIQTPQQMADELLAHLTPTTAVSVGAPVSVAKQKAYQLILTPHAAASTIDHVVIAVDSVTGLPLQVQVFAKGQKSVAVKLGFGAISYSTPAASNFAFKAPPGSTVANKALGGTHPTTPAGENATKAKPAAASGNAGADQSVTVGQDWTSVEVFRGVQIPKQLNQYLAAATSVTGSFGQAKLLETSLVNVLVLNDGRVAVGAVNASTLEAAIAAAP